MLLAVLPTYRASEPTRKAAFGVGIHFSRMRRAEFGIYHHVSGLYLRRYAAEMAWREDHRRDPNGAFTDTVVRLSMARGHSVDWRGYWRRWELSAAA